MNEENVNVIGTFFCPGKTHSPCLASLLSFPHHAPSERNKLQTDCLSCTVGSLR